MTGYTPGPWMASESVMSRRDGPLWFIDAGLTPVAEATNEANARFIAAAPDLLAALQRAVETIRALHGIGLSGRSEAGMWKLYQSSPEMTIINAAIAKALGTVAVLLTFLCVAVPASAQSQVGLLPYVTLSVGSGIDLVTTLNALHSVPGAVEANPVLSHGGDPGLIVGKVVSTAALMVVMRQIGLKGHPRAAQILGYVSGAALAGLGARNARVGR